jgi:polysaccharide export outer membrane protein
MTPSRLALAAVLGGLVLGIGCSSARPRATMPAELGPRPYIVGTGDTLEVIVWGEDKLSGPVQVRPDGMITIALVGDVAAAGRSADELAAELQSRLTQYVSSPNVVVRVQATGSRRFFVIGNVRAPGAYDMTADQTFLQALAKAGGLNEFADADDVRIIRRSGASPVLPDYDAITRGDVPDVVLEPDDTIVVP